MFKLFLGVMAVIALTLSLHAQGLSFSGKVASLNQAHTQFSIGPDVTVIVKPNSLGQTFLIEAEHASDVRIVVEQIYK